MICPIAFAVSVVYSVYWYSGSIFSCAAGDQRAPVNNERLANWSTIGAATVGIMFGMKVERMDFSRSFIAPGWSDS